MALFSDNEREVARAIGQLVHGNPFLPQRVDAEQLALGEAFIETAAVWHVEAALDGINPNLPQLQELVEKLAADLRGHLLRKAKASPEECALYQAVVFHTLYQRWDDLLFSLVEAGENGESTTVPVRSYNEFKADVEYFFDLEGRKGLELEAPSDAADMFAIAYQIRRAFHYIFRRIYGASPAAAWLRARVWESIFTHDARRYRRALRDVIGRIPTLVVGETGTGKELVARAIGLSRFIPFDETKRSFELDCTKDFHAVNLAALSPSLIESELFGHRRGSFTGAVQDRAGWLESCGAGGTVFLDEIGELNTTLQVKLLRVLETRVFQRLGETKERRFEAKIVAATNRDLDLEVQEGRMRSDFYYRLRADVIRTPSLREQTADSPGELRNLVTILARRMVDDREADQLVDEVVDYIDERLGNDYPWPGNVRELEQCVRNILVRGEYQPAAVAASAAETNDWTADIEAGSLTAEELLARYCTVVYSQTGSYEQAARRLGLDRRTVRARIDAELLERLRAAK